VPFHKDNTCTYSEVWNYTSFDLNSNCREYGVDHYGNVVNTGLEWLCEFHGIRCVDNKITSIYLDNNYYQGTIMSDFDYFSDLKELHLDGNKLRGKLLSELGNSTSLKHLTLSHNILSGAIPLEIKNLLSGSLIELQLQSNNLEGDLIVEKKGVKVIADCGKTQTNDALVECTGCSHCCVTDGRELECIKINHTYPAFDSPFSSTDLPVSIYAISIICLAYLCSFGLLLIFLLLRNISWIKRRMDSISSDATDSFQEESAYKFLLSRNKIAFTVSFFTILLQTIILFYFLSASDYTSKSSDWVYPLECEAGEECENNKSVECYVWIFVVVIILIFLSSDFIDGLRMMCVGCSTLDRKKVCCGCFSSGNHSSFIRFFNIIPSSNMFDYNGHAKRCGTYFVLKRP